MHWFAGPKANINSGYLLLSDCTTLRIPCGRRAQRPIRNEVCLRRHSVRKIVDGGVTGGTHIFDRSTRVGMVMAASCRAVNQPL